MDHAQLCDSIHSMMMTFNCYFTQVVICPYDAAAAAVAAVTVVGAAATAVSTAVAAAAAAAAAATAVATAVAAYFASPAYTTF